MDSLVSWLPSSLHVAISGWCVSSKVMGALGEGERSGNKATHWMQCYVFLVNFRGVNVPSKQHSLVIQDVPYQIMSF